MGKRQRADPLPKAQRRTFDPSQLTGFARTVVQLIYGIGIAYYCDLIGLENNIDPDD
ncbi:hypothetical protein [Bradyrhizobium yuanmingense]|uniref:hypothetical protein n=1 Tax=Bradyrhizobium yuanmingense TaxID=108015 RepID=UPI0023B961E3|nr:hypothetical protein [Bradyrhizobium yuanmingense]MDF0585073.1 hypothetical protein [Bradyrhizobium yuanmingense]